MKIQGRPLLSVSEGGGKEAETDYRSPIEVKRNTGYKEGSKGMRDRVRKRVDCVTICGA